MEQLDDIILSFDAFVERDDGGVVPFSLRLARPSHDEGRGHFCRVECSFLGDELVRIFGVDGEQVCELSILLVRKSPVGINVVLIDAKGDRVGIPEIDLPQKPERD